MKYFVVGISHKTASVQLREQAALTQETQVALINQLYKLQWVSEVMIVSTCNRTEIYYVHPVDSHDQVIDIWQSFSPSIHNLRNSVYFYENTQAQKQLFSVAAGLDSLILGEPQILGQLKQSLSQSLRLGSIGKYLHFWTQKAFQVAKKIRTHTGIGNNAISVAFAAVNLAKQISDQFSEQQVLLIGAGETIELVLKHLLTQGIHKIVIINRSIENAKQLAERCNLTIPILSFDDLPQALISADIVISSTAADHHIIDVEMVKSTRQARKYMPTLMIDIAVPRDIDPRVNALEDVYLYSIDDLENIIEEGVKKRKEAAKAALPFIEEAIYDMQHWQNLVPLNPKIGELAQYAKDQSESLAQVALSRLTQGEAPEQVLQTLTHQLSRRLLHQHIHDIKTQASANLKLPTTLNSS